MYEGLDGLDKLVSNFTKEIDVKTIDSMFSEVDINELLLPSKDRSDSMKEAYSSFVKEITRAAKSYISQYGAITSIEIHVALNSLLNKYGLNELDYKGFKKHIFSPYSRGVLTLKKSLNSAMGFDEEVKISYLHVGPDMKDLVFKIPHLTDQLLFYKNRENAKEYLKSNFLVQKENKKINEEKPSSYISVEEVISRIRGLKEDYKEYVIKSPLVREYLEDGENGVRRPVAENFIRRMNNGGLAFKEGFDKLIGWKK